MKDTKVYKILLLTFIFIFVALIKINIVYAAVYDGTIIGKDIEINKSWKIKFNMELDESTVNDSNIVVMDSDGNAVPISLQLEDNGTVVEVTPKAQYTYGKTYNLIVKSGLKSISDKNIYSESKMQFNVKDNPTSNAKYTVTIDAGHGGDDAGNVSASGLKEKDVDLSVSLKVGKILEQNGVNVVYTRKDDNVSWNSSSDLQSRFNIANNAKSDLFVTIHCNSYTSNSSVNGIETYYAGYSDEAKNVAGKIQNEMVSYTSHVDRGIKAGVLQHEILRGTLAPAVMVELGFMTNSQESTLLGSDDYQDKSASAVANGILESLNSLNENKDLTIGSISDLSDNITVGNEYSLPISVQATMSDGSSRKVGIIWNSSTVDSSKDGTFTYKGTAPGYSKQVTFTLTIAKGTSGTPPSSTAPIIVIDPGHGMGSDVGATGIGGLQEDDITLAVGLKTGKILEEHGVNVVYTRTTDMRSTPMSVTESLQKRCDISNNVNAKYFVCIHTNSFDSSSAYGTETLYYTGNEEGKKLASYIQNSIVEEVGTYNRGLKDGSWLYIARNTVAPAVLTELGFVTNPDDAAKLSSDEYRQKFAQAIADGILKALGIN
ncbi:N-acetylmuramoyl-L-alanine amidase [Clostridium sp. WILCCON 0269]|uniref:N-acetylmuramoyl-L-alanine amidase n=1 Tax=Candidatus Clostridium eludens TaxID=3381663 RepID=A0ABW8SJS8_9CLOT